MLGVYFRESETTAKHFFEYYVEYNSDFTGKQGLHSSDSTGLAPVWVELVGSQPFSEGFSLVTFFLHSPKPTFLNSNSIQKQWKS